MRQEYSHVYQLRMREVRVKKRIRYAHPHSTSATIEIQVKLRNIDEAIHALIDHRFKINIILKVIYEKEKWPIDINHRCILKAIKNKREHLYGVYSTFKTKIGNVGMDQNFFV